MKPTHFVFTKTTLAAAAAGVLLFVAVRAQAPAPTPRVHAQVTVPTAAARSVAGPSVAQRVPLDEIYDASVYAYGKSYCSATLVGPRALVTAGHCLDSDGTPLRIMFGVRSEQYVGVCARPDTFKQIDSATFVDDVALCTLDRDVLGVPFDVVDFDQRPEETPVSLTGFGCDPTDMSPAAKIAQLRSGSATISTIDGELDQIVTIGATSCGGDSGGGVYVTQGSRRLIGVNAAVDLTKANTARVTPFSSESIKSFVRSYHPVQKGGAICGTDILPGIGGCRR